MQGDIFMVGRFGKKAFSLAFLGAASVLLNFTAFEPLSSTLSLTYLCAGAIGACAAGRHALNEGRSLRGVLAYGALGYTIGVVSVALAGSIFYPN